ncbi:hypothetical protein FXO38_36328 [Capsicum annuum]|nr:hypothetical protein FXO38_36328 [Capsicum annuum]
MGNFGKYKGKDRPIAKNRFMHFFHIKREICMHLCEIPLETPVRTSMLIGNHKQSTVYEGEGFLCKTCGRLGHTTVASGLHISIRTPPTKDLIEDPATSKEDQEWRTVTFPQN